MTRITGTVETPETPQPPNNYIAQAAADASTVQELDELVAHATQHGYSPDGQVMKLLNARREELSGAPAAKRGRK